MRNLWQACTALNAALKRKLTTLKLSTSPWRTARKRSSPSVRTAAQPCLGLAAKAQRTRSKRKKLFITRITLKLKEKAQRVGWVFCFGTKWISLLQLLIFLLGSFRGRLRRSCFSLSRLFWLFIILGNGSNWGFRSSRFRDICFRLIY